jgi:hypothetical protein
MFFAARDDVERQYYSRPFDETVPEPVVGLTTRFSTVRRVL